MVNAEALVIFSYSSSCSFNDSMRKPKCGVCPWVKVREWKKEGKQGEIEIKRTSRNING